MLNGLGSILPKASAAPKEAAPAPLKAQDAQVDPQQKSAAGESFPIPHKDIHKPAEDKVDQTQTAAKSNATVEREAQPAPKDANAKESGKLSADKSSLTKEKALAVFAERMQAEFNLEPEDVLTAFTKMDPAALAQTPEKSAQVFIEQLPITDGQKTKAHEIYSEMLAWSAAANMTSELSAKNQTAQIKVMSQKQASMQSRLKGLDQLSDKFFMTGTHQRNAAMTGVHLPSEMKATDDVALAESALKFNSGMPEVESASDVQTGQTILDEMGFEVKNQSADAIPAADLDVPWQLDEASFTEKAMATNADATLAEDAMAASADPEIQQIENLLGKLNDSATQVTEADGGIAAVAGGKGANDSDAGSESSEEQSQSEFAAVDSLNNKNLNKGSEFVLKPVTATKAEMNENVSQIMNRAQALVKDGGGEMKVRLNPEGLGEVNLKVSVHNGEVQIEMIAANDQTKQLLEKGLVELKDSLLSHKLQVDHIKVETGQNVQQDFMADQRESAERQFQQRFLQEFMHGNDQRRFGFNNIGSARMPSSQTQDEAINSLYNPYGSKKNPDRKLDLVA